MPRSVVPGDFLPPRQLGQARTRGLEEPRCPASLSAPGEGAAARRALDPALLRPRARGSEGRGRRAGGRPLLGALPLSCRGVREDSVVREAFSLERRRFRRGSLWVDLGFFWVLVVVVFFF